MRPPRPAALLLPLALGPTTASPTTDHRLLRLLRERCARLDPAAAGVAHATVTNRGVVAAGTTLGLPGNDASCAQDSQVVPVDVCRVALEVATGARSGVLVEVWLPLPAPGEDEEEEEGGSSGGGVGGWNGRLVTTGNGGLGGCVDYKTMAYTVQNGFASVGTNNGHNGTSGIQFLNNEDVVIDFAWRALHVGVETGKALLPLFYGAQAHKSYFLGCSLGGRQGIQAADRFPGDFDGVVAGAPATDFNALYSWRASFLPTTGPAGADGFITPATWRTTIHDEVLRQCDEALDGAADGILEDPSRCRFDPGALLCGDGDEDDGGSAAAAAAAAAAAGAEEEEEAPASCLTPAQVDVVRTIFRPYRWADGALLYPAMGPGGEPMAADGLYAGRPYAPSAGWFRYAVHGDAAWDPAAYGLADAARAAAADPGGVRTWPAAGALAAFRRRGGRLLVHHGGHDGQISSLASPRLYGRLRRAVADGDDDDVDVDVDVDDVVRFFRVSGMYHCGAGPGAWVVGQAGGAAAQGPFDAAHNVLAAVVAWAEGGAAPETIAGTKYVGDDASGGGVAFVRRHCRWPMRNVFLGEGRDSRDPDSWACRRMSEADVARGEAGLLYGDGDDDDGLMT